MAQKSNPYAIRLGYNQVWDNYFFPTSRKEQIELMKKDKLIRDYFYSLFPDITQLKTEYTKNNIFIYLHITEINLVLGENNEKLEKILKELYSLIKDDKVSIKINLVEIKKPYTCAQAVANLIASQIKNRLPSRRVLTNMLSKLSFEREEVKGVKLQVGGRLDGKEIAERRKVIQGKMPLSTIDSNIDVGRKEVITSYGKIGIKVLIYKGRIWQKKKTNN